MASPQEQREPPRGTELMDLKRQKSNCKSAFTRIKNRLLNAVEDESDRSTIRGLQSKLDAVQDDLSQCYETFGKFLRLQADVDAENKLLDEMEETNNQYSAAHCRVQEYFADSLSETRSVKSQDDNMEFNLGKDMWKQMRRVSIPNFAGDKSKYESWKAAFMACIDNAPATPEYKLLQLRQYLKGDALNCIDNLGHSEVAYNAAKSRLERKYGGQKRQVQLFLDQLESFPIIKEESATNMEKFADLLDVAVINLTEANHMSDLGDGALYLRLQKKLPVDMLTRYHRWIHENNEEESVSVLRDWIIQESQFMTVATETVKGLNSVGPTPRQKKEYTHLGNSSTNERHCQMCDNNHGIWHCQVFRQIPVQERWEKAKSLSLCFRCLGDRHQGKKCKYSRICGINGCQKSHHRLLHSEEVAEQVREPYSQNINAEVRNYSTQKAKGYICLRTVPVIVVYCDKKMQINAILDDGSTQTYINTDVALELGIPMDQTSNNMSVNVINGITTNFQSVPVQLGLRSLNGQLNISMEANTIDNVTGDLQAIEISKFSSQWDHLQGIKFPSVGSRQHIDLLIGLDYADLHQSLYEIHGKPGDPIARLTPLGWTCVGNLNSGVNQVNLTCHTFLLSEKNRENNSELNKTLKRFWEVDDGGFDSVTSLSPENKIVLSQTEKSIKSVDGRYQVDIPWKDNKHQLCNNREMAEKRLINAEKRLVRDKDLYETYNKVFESYSDKCYITKVPSDKNSEGTWYIPHFPVVRPDRNTTKVRIVFDASAKHKGISLNDTIHQGPPLQTDLFDVLIRFRLHSVAIACDIQEMYLQVGIPPPDRKYHRFLWRSTPNSEIEEYEFNRLVFGVNASPFLAQCVSRSNAKKYQEEFPMAYETVLKSTYMDDSIDSVVDPKTGIEMYHELSQLWQRAGMYARKWMSNSKEVLKEIPSESLSSEAIDFCKNETPITKTLGVLWQPKSDEFSFRFRTFGEQSNKVTKRSFLSRIATLYDPLGFLVPYTIRAKMLMQEVWTVGTEWDDQLPEEVAVEIDKWFDELQSLQEITIPRNLKYKEQLTSDIHTFVDASLKAYCAVVYIRNETGENDIVETKMVASKSKVVPLKGTSIPRLELMAAVLGLRLSEKVCSVLEYNIEDVCFWSDSLNTLWWIRNQSRQFKPFVANRIGEIHSKTNPDQWRYVPSKQNPADLGSRGLSVKELRNEAKWWRGPEFLVEKEDMWPKNQFRPDNTANVDQRKGSIKTESHEFFVGLIIDKEDRLNPERFSTWKQLVRIYAWVSRFIANCKLDKSERLLKKCLHSNEIRSAEVMIISQVQRQAFSEEYKALVKGKELPKSSKILKLNPKLDEDSIMRSDSRLKFVDFVPYETRCPIILPRKNWVTKLIVRNYHRQCCHGGTNQTLAALSAKYWIIAAREEIRETENECTVCRRKNAKAAQQIMGPLPEARVGKSMRAFSQTAVDYAGPFFTMQGRGKSRKKRYLCLFTCMACRAVHLELSYNLDTDSFLNAFYRFVSRRGIPESVLSDNGTNFVGAVRELRELVDQLDHDKIIDSMANKGITWKFIPPAAPHFGGVHESMVKSAKRALFAILGNADVNDEELQTAFCGAEGLINSRPLSYQTSNAMDQPVLTPNHFLHGQLGGQFAPESVDVTSFNLRKRWRRVQELMKHFWNRWFRELLPTLGTRKKWQGQYRDFRVGDIVIVIDPDVGRGQWKLGKIIRVFEGPDGHVRVVDVQMGNRVLKRPINRVCLIVESCDNSN